MSQEIATRAASKEDQRKRRMNLLLNRLPARVRRSVHWLLEPRRKWVRIPAGIVMLIGGMLWFLPILGLWMLPVGLLLLAEDIALIRDWSGDLLEWVERRHPSWLGIDT